MCNIKRSDENTRSQVLFAYMTHEMFEREEKHHDEETDSPARFRAEAALHEGSKRDSSKPVGAYLSPAKGAGERPRSRGDGTKRGRQQRGGRGGQEEDGEEEARRRDETKETKGGKRRKRNAKAGELKED